MLIVKGLRLLCDNCRVIRVRDRARVVHTGESRCHRVDRP